MKRIAIIFLVTIGFSSMVMAQHSIKGRVVDEEMKPIAFTTVVLLNPVDSTMKYFGVTKTDGLYQIKNIKPAKYLMQFSFSGMQSVYELVTIPSQKGEDFGDKVLLPITLDEVIVEAELIPIKFKTDTLEYDAKAFKTRAGASVEELLEKLPGVEVDEAGNVKAQGEDVTKVLVDGKEFFGNDPKVATKNLPADALDKVQVLDRKSDQAAFTGIEDGVRDRTINLILNEDHKKGYFGEINAGAGTQGSYKTQAKIYRFSSTIQTAVLGMLNNINEFGFTNKGNNAFGQGIKGINESFAGGLNLSYNTEAGDRYYLSYLGNSRKKDLKEETSTQNFLENGNYNQLAELIESERDRPHDIDFGINHSFGKTQKLILKGDVTAGSNRTLSQSLINSDLDANPINRLSNNTINNSDELAINVNGSYSIKLNGDDTQLSTRYALSYSENESVLDWTNITTLFDPAGINTIHQLRNNNTDVLAFSATPTFTQKLNKYWAIDIGTRVAINNSNLNRTEGEFNDGGDLINGSIPAFSADQTIIQPELTFRRGTLKKQFSIGFKGYTNQFDKVLTGVSSSKPQYFFLTPSLFFRNNYRSGRRVEIRYGTSIGMPSANQLFPIANTLNQLAVYQGNLALKPEYRHNLNFTWSIFDEFSFTSLFVRLNGSYTKDKISFSQNVNDQLIQTTMPVNVDNAQVFNSYIGFSAPIRSLGINMSITWRETWTRNRSLINDQENVNTNLTHMVDLNFQNRSKDKVNIRVGGSISFTESQFSIAEIPDNNFFNTSYYMNLRYTPGKRWNLQTNATVTNFNSQSFSESVSIPLITASMSYAFMQAEKASLTLKGFDLLNKFVGIQRISNGNYLQQKEWNTIGQYFMLTFAYRFR